VTLRLPPVLNPFEKVFSRRPEPRKFSYQREIPHVLFLIFYSRGADDIFGGDRVLRNAFVGFLGPSSFCVTNFWIDFHQLLLQRFFLPDCFPHSFRDFKGCSFEVVGAMLLGRKGVLGGDRVPPSLGIHAHSSSKEGG
jgi:hypothetical protein